jgi:hypothetical protein
MSKTYNVIITVVAPEGWEFEPYGGADFDNLFEAQGAEVVNISVEEEK